MESTFEAVERLSDAVVSGQATPSSALVAIRALQDQWAYRLREDEQSDDLNALWLAWTNVGHANLGVRFLEAAIADDSVAQTKALTNVHAEKAVLENLLAARDDGDVEKATVLIRALGEVWGLPVPPQFQGGKE